MSLSAAPPPSGSSDGGPQQEEGTLPLDGSPLIFPLPNELRDKEREARLSEQGPLSYTFIRRDKRRGEISGAGADAPPPGEASSSNAPSNLGDVAGELNARQKFNIFVVGDKNSGKTSFCQNWNFGKVLDLQPTNKTHKYRGYYEDSSYHAKKGFTEVCLIDTPPSYFREVQPKNCFKKAHAIIFLLDPKTDTKEAFAKKLVDTCQVITRLREATGRNNTQIEWLLIRDDESTAHGDFVDVGVYCYMKTQIRFKLHSNTVPAQLVCDNTRSFIYSVVQHLEEVEFNFPDEETLTKLVTEYPEEPKKKGCC